MRSLFITLLIVTGPDVLAQKFTINGIVKDKSNGETLIGASIYNNPTAQGTTSNTFGFYSITLSKDTVSLMISYVGYETQSLQFYLQRDTTIGFELNAGNVLKAVTVTADQEDQIQNTTRMGTIDMPVDQIKAMPALLGETDVLKTLQLLPGVQAGTEGSSGLYVRGGGPDQNLILLDGVPVYNASHLFGFFSVFNADAINHVELIKGGFPARYGGRLSSVIDINMKEGNSKEIKGEGSIGLVSAKFTLEGPIKKDKTSFLISGRRTYIDILARPLIKLASEGDATAGYFFYDLNAKINHKFNDRDRIYLSAYLGDDKAHAYFKDNYTSGNTQVTYREDAGLQWGNLTTALRWNRIWNSKLFSNVTATYSRFRFNLFDDYQERITENGETETTYYKDQYLSGIRDYALKIDFDYIPAPNHFVKFGGQLIDHLFTPGAFSYRSSEQADTTIGAKKTYAQEWFVYAEDDVRLTEKLKCNIGIHGSGFFVNNKAYGSVQPRISARYLLSESISVKSSFASMVQFIHLLTNAGLGLPTDLWVPSTGLIGPEKSFITAAGLAYNRQKGYEISMELYYKKMTGLIEYKDGASYVNVKDDWQTKVDTGNGTSYGAELFLQKKTGKLNGWVGYTLSWANRSFPNINEGKSFPYKYDRRHDFEIASAYEFTPKRSISLTWVFGTGNTTSLPSASYAGHASEMQQSLAMPGAVLYYEGRNNYRMRAYHRLDLSYTTKKKTKWGERAWVIGVYNAYSRRNPFFMDVGYDKQGNKKFIQYSLFPIIPSISYQFKF